MLALVWVLFSLGLHVPPYIPGDVLDNPVIQETENAAMDLTRVSNVNDNSSDGPLLKLHLCFIQDVYSFKKEYGFDGAFNNLLAVIQKGSETTHLDFQEGLDYPEKLSVDRFHACRRELPSFNLEIDQYLNLYADGLIDFAAGNLQWSRVSRRYRTFTNDEDRKNNIMRLALE